MINEPTIDAPKFKVLKSPNPKRKQKKKAIPLNEKIKLETVLGLSVTSNAGLSLDSNSGNVAYFAGCVVVLYNPKKGKQTHLFNTSKKPISCLHFSGDGRYLATGESGHQPAVRVWDLTEMSQVAEFDGHKFGIRCVAFSPNSKYIVSVGYQHDMVVNVWNWKKNIKVASNKVASKVLDVAFSEDGSMFVTVGNRHVKFWYLNASKSKNKLETTPLLGRNGILGEHQNNTFCGVCCHRKDGHDLVFAITEGGTLCQFNDKRVLSKWVSLKTNRATSLSMGDRYIFVGCSGGLVRVFSTLTLNFITSLPLPHYLGIDVSLSIQESLDKSLPSYADTVAVRYDSSNDRLCSIYDDRSIYVWDVSDVKRVGKSRSALYHNGAIWGLDIFPGSDASSLPAHCLATCGSDHTVRFWRSFVQQDGSASVRKNIYSNDLIKVLYIDSDLSNLREKPFNPVGKMEASSQEKNGIRCIKFRPDGKHLVSGDRIGNIRIHDMDTMNQVNQIEAHDSEVLCLEFTSPETGLNLLVSGSRDRLVHVFNASDDYCLVQTLDEHSAAVTAVNFVFSNLQLGLVSCSADKSILFRTANVSPDFQFTLTRHVVSRTTLYDMEVDASKKFVAIACQDRNIRIYNTRTGKLKKNYSGSMSSEGVLIRLQLDPTSSFLATCCSDKSLSLFDFFSGECSGQMTAHSEVPTGVKFLDDLRHLVSIGADGCMFIWKLDSEMTEQMNKRRDLLKDRTDTSKTRKSLSSPADSQTTSDAEASLNGLADDNSYVFRFSPGQLPAWARSKFSKEAPASQQQHQQQSSSWNVPLVPKGKWAQNVDPQSYPLPPRFPFGAWRDLNKAEDSPASGVTIIRDDEDNEEDEEDEFDEFSGDQSRLGVEADQPIAEGEDGEAEEDDAEDDDDDDGVEKESNDNDDEVAKEETIFLPTLEALVEASTENLFKVEENHVTKIEDVACEGENYLSLEEDAELKSVPSSPSSSEQAPKVSPTLLGPVGGSGDADAPAFDLSHETFEMTLKRLEVEMATRSNDTRCSLSAKYFNNNSIVNGNTAVPNAPNDNDNNNNNNNLGGLDDANNNSYSALTSNSSRVLALRNKRDIADDPKKKQFLMDPSGRTTFIGSLGRRQGRSLGGSELRLAVKTLQLESPKNTGWHSDLTPLASSQIRKWKSLHDVREDLESTRKESLPPGSDDKGVMDAQKARASVGGGVKPKSILRSQTPNVTLTSTAASNNWSKEKKVKKLTAVGAKVEGEPRKPLMRVRSYRMATESSQAKQLGSGPSSTAQQLGRKLPSRSSKQFQSTPNLTKDGLPIQCLNDAIDEEAEEPPGSLVHSALRKPLSVLNVSLSGRALHDGMELETLDEDTKELRAEPNLSGLSSYLAEKKLSSAEVTGMVASAPIDEISRRREPIRLGLGPAEEADLPERDPNSMKRVHSNITLLRPFGQVFDGDRPASSTIQSISQQQRRLLPSEPRSKLSTSYIEPRSISSAKLIQLREFENIDSVLPANQKREESPSKRIPSQSKWGSLRSPTNVNITFARPPSRNLHARSPDPFQNWAKRVETVQHQWEAKHMDPRENGQPDPSSTFLARKKLGSGGDGEEEREHRRWSSMHDRSGSTDSVGSREACSPSRNPGSESPTLDRSRRSASSITFETRGRIRHLRTSSADGNGSDEGLPREGEPSSGFRDVRVSKSGIRQRVAFSPVVCMLSNESTPEEEKAVEACEKLKEAVSLVSQLYEEVREFRGVDDSLVEKIRSTAEECSRKLQLLVGPPQSDSQLDRCAEDLTNKMYELIRRKIDSATPTTF